MWGSIRARGGGRTQGSVSMWEVLRVWVGIEGVWVE